LPNIKIEKMQKRIFFTTKPYNNSPPFLCHPSPPLPLPLMTTDNGSQCPLCCRWLPFPSSLPLPLLWLFLPLPS
jgi:hypothetical protein